MIITVSNASSLKKTLVRNAARALIAKYVMSMPYEDFANSVIGFAMQSDMRKTLSKIYPIKSVDIRQFTLVEKKTFTAVEKGEGFDISKLQDSKPSVKKEEEATS
jgi:ribosomal protein S3AE